MNKQSDAQHSLTVASYNIHGCVGPDGRRDPGRVAEVLAELDSQIIGLQEVGSQQTTEDKIPQLHFLAQQTGLRSVAGPTIERVDAHYGNALLTAFPVREIRRWDLSVAGCEPRGALDVNLEVQGAPLRVIVTHWGLNSAERRRQAKQLLEHLPTGQGQPLLLMGDFNEWFPWSQPLRWLRERFGTPPSPHTFPSRLPLFALDRIWTSPREAITDIRAHKTRRARRASDHLPVMAQWAVGGSPFGNKSFSSGVQPSEG